MVDHFVLAKSVGGDVARSEQGMPYGAVGVGLFFVEWEVVEFFTALVHRDDAGDQSPFHYPTFNFVQLRGV
ncbi:hypothetical protein PFLuk1_00163 [Pseudomonas fluorescens]|nr:hypothetical protein PFLuk1_00163 [Pseudomonas fluorescens]